jgi:hypothetical protein
LWRAALQRALGNVMINRGLLTGFWSAAIFVAVAVMLIPASARAGRTVQGNAAATPADPSAPSALTAQTLAGKPIDLLAQPGWKVIYFWSAECPCVKACEGYSLRPLAGKYAGKVSFYAVVSGAYDLGKPLGELSREIDARNLPYPVLLDKSHAVAKRLNAEVTPEVYVLDPRNRIVYSGMPDDSKRFLLDTGNRGMTQSYLAVALAQALAGKPVTTARTRPEGCSIAW